MRTLTATPPILVLFAALAGSAMPPLVRAAEPEPTPAPTATAEATSPPRAHSLADVARRIHLRKLPGEGGGTPAITNANLRDLAAKGVISSGSATQASPTPQPQGEAIPIGPTAQEVAQRRLEDQQEKVKTMESDLAEFDKKVTASRTARDSSLPQNLPPGVRDQNLITREKALAELEAERAKLEELRRRAAAEAAKPTPTPE